MKKRSYAQLKKMVDHFFSVWIRRSFALPSGMCACVTCRTVKHWKEMQCGHFVSRVHLATRWDERNAAPQCAKCNVLLRGNMAEYAIWISKRHGPKIMQDLIDLKNKTVKYHRSQLEGMISELQGRIANLDNGGDSTPRGEEVGHDPVRLHGAARDNLR